MPPVVAKKGKQEAVEEETHYFDEISLVGNVNIVSNESQ